jgi:hypothetical protein
MIPTGTLTKKIHGRDRGPDAHRLVPLRALLERRRDDREGGRGDQRGAEALEPAAEDQHRRGVGEPVQQGREREDDEPGEEDALAPEQVAGAAAEEQEAAERQRVGVDDPLQVALGHVQVGLDRRQRHVHDRRVEDDHELRQADEREDEPGVDVAIRHPAAP